MKKKILLSMMACLLVGSSLSLVACGDESSKINSYESIQTSLNTYLEDATLFKEGTTIGNIQTDFYFDNFSYKNNEGDAIEGDANYILLNAYSMNYIQEYYLLLNKLGDGKYDFSALNQSLESLDASFEAVKVESKNVYNADTNANLDIYNGFFAQYKDKAKDFIDCSYVTAMELSNFLIEQGGTFDGLATDTQTSEKIQFYADTQILYVFNDIRAVLLDSGKGQELVGNELYDGAVAQLSYYASLSNRHINTLTAENVAELMDLTNYFNGERGYTNIAIEKFSLYDYVKVYTSSIEDYMKDDVNAQSYYTQLQKYFSNSNSYLNQYQTYLATNIYE